MQKIKLTLQENQNVFFTSDQHFNHQFIISITHRPFQDLDEMDRVLIKNWNDTVQPNDYVFTLGDFAWSNSPHIINNYLNQLQGQIFFLPGNHDKERAIKHLPNHVTKIDDITNLSIKYQNNLAIVYLFVLSHYPLLTWSKRNIGCKNLFGHIHTLKDNTLNTGYDKYLNITHQQYDVGVDNNNYRPVSLSFLLTHFDKLQKMEDLLNDWP